VLVSLSHRMRLTLQKFVSRKARKFELQGRRLFLPATELSYVFGCLTYTPRKSILHTLLPRLDEKLSELEKKTPEEYYNSQAYWDGEWNLLLGMV
jgi:hypothetical protein